jgi:hypothetical protein
MGGTAEAMYNKGIEASMKQWGIADDAAIAAYTSSENKPVGPADFLNSPALNEAPIKFSSNSDVQKLQIATQKWLALYPDGMEAWADLRRSKVLKLYPVVNNDNTDIPAGERPRRIPFIDFEKNTNKEAVTAAVALLGGADKATTPLWWDK